MCVRPQETCTKQPARTVSCLAPVCHAQAAACSKCAPLMHPCNATDAHRSTPFAHLCLPHRGVPRPAPRVSWRQQSHPEPAPPQSGGAHRQPRCHSSRSRGQGRSQGCWHRQGRQPAGCCCCCCWGEAGRCEERWVAAAWHVLRWAVVRTTKLGFSQMLALSAATKCQICLYHAVRCAALCCAELCRMQVTHLLRAPPVRWLPRRSSPSLRARWQSTSQSGRIGRHPAARPSR